MLRFYVSSTVVQSYTIRLPISCVQKVNFLFFDLSQYVSMGPWPYLATDFEGVGFYTKIKL